MTRPALALLLLAAAVATAAAQPAPTRSRLARVASRDARLFLRVDDRQAFMRRARRTDIAKALSGDEAAFARDSLLRISADLAMFLPPVVLDAIPAVLSVGEGEVALSVEGFVLEGGRARPDVLFVAERAGFEGLVADLAAAARGRADVEDIVFDRDLPFEVTATPSIGRHRGVDVVRVETTDGAALTLAEHDGLLIGARRFETLRVALDRMDRPQFGSLSDEPAFVRARAEVGIEPGSLFAYTNLRLLRRDDAILRADEVRLRGFLVGDLDEYDVGALVVRGVNDRFEARGWLEVGASRRAGLPLYRGDAPFEAPAQVAGDVTAALSFRLDGARFGRLLTALNSKVGGIFDAAQIEETFVAATTPAQRFELMRLLGGEVLLTHPRLIQGRLPTTVAMIRTPDPARLTAVLDSIVAGSSLARSVDTSFGRTYTFHILANLHVARPAFTVRDGWLIGAPNSMALHAACRPLASGAPGLARTEEYVAPFDALDLPVDGARSASLFLDTPLIGPAASIWLTGIAPRAMFNDAASDAADFLNDLLQLWDDPEVHEALHGTLVVARSRPNGVRIEAVGP